MFIRGCLSPGVGASRAAMSHLAVGTQQAVSRHSGQNTVFTFPGTTLYQLVQLSALGLKDQISSLDSS